MTTAHRGWIGGAALLLAPALACAQGNPNIRAGNPVTMSNHDADCIWTATLVPPSTASAFAPDCAALTNGLTAGGYNAAGGWDVVYSNLLGNVSVGDYRAWIDNRPGYTCGPFSAGNQTGGTRRGGALLCLDYQPLPGDPAAVNNPQLGPDGQPNGNGNSNGNARWIQAIRTNCPIDGQTPPSFAEPMSDFVQYIDNFGNTVGQGPFYDPIGAADATTFLDIPARSCNPEPDCTIDCTWSACVFIATEGTNPLNGRRVLTIYGTGVEWGFTFTCTPLPEPGALALVGMGGIAAFRRRR